jgi:hypothetical protein
LPLLLLGPLLRLLVLPRMGLLLRRRLRLRGFARRGRSTGRRRPAGDVRAGLRSHRLARGGRGLRLARLGDVVRFVVCDIDDPPLRV